MAGKRLYGSPTYLPAARALLRESGCSVVSFRNDISGLAYIEDLSIESPPPRGPLSYAALAHEVGHQLLHRERLKPGRRRPQRWVEELEAWLYALETFDRFRLPGRARVKQEAGACLHVQMHEDLSRSKVPEERRAQMLARSPEWLHPYIPKLRNGRLRPPRWEPDE